MIVYEADKKQFLFDNDHDDIEDLILGRYLAATGRRVQSREIQSWKASLSYVAKVLRDDGIPNDAVVAVELHIPQSSKRIDVTLTGTDASGRKNAVLIELKQWQAAYASDKDAMVVTQLGGGMREVVHPSYQAWSYATLLEGFNEAVYAGRVSIRPCAYLHNYVEDGVITSDQYSGYLTKAPLFLKGSSERQRLREFIKQHIGGGGGKAVLDELVNGRIRPSKALADALSDLLKAQAEFVLIDEQKEVFEAALASARVASSRAPRVIIVEGGPGTGKSVLAVNLLVRLAKLGLNGKYVSKNAAPRKVYESRLGGAMSRNNFSALFSGSGNFYEAEANKFDFLIVDEAHRLNEKSGLYGNLGDNQVMELINSSACTIFLIDEDQRVTLSDIGSKQAIRSFALEKSAAIEEYELSSQFRCNGSNGYLAWLDNALDIRNTANELLDTTEYEFKVFDTPDALHNAILAKNSRNKARVVAGYCWPWLSKKDPSAYDIVIGEQYKRKWNLDKDGSLWIIASESVEQVGCIHTCQGLEVDYIGVIVGPDLIVREGKVICSPEARDRNDRSIRGYKTRLKTEGIQVKAEVDVLIKNTYRTLMTRGMKGCYVFCTDEETRNYFKQLIKTSAAEPRIDMAYA